MSAGTAPYKLSKKNRTAKCQRSIVIDTKLTGQFTIRFTAKHLSKAWRATLQVGEVRIIAIRPAGHTEVDYLFDVQVIEFSR